MFVSRRVILFSNALIRIIYNMSYTRPYTSHRFPKCRWYPEVPTSNLDFSDIRWQGHWTGEHKPSSSWFGKLWWSTGICNTVVYTSTWAKIQLQVLTWLWRWYTDVLLSTWICLINWGNVYKFTQESIHSYEARTKEVVYSVWVHWAA